MKYKNLFEVAEDVGFEQLDTEIEAWIEMGEFDDSVKTRAVEIGFVKNPERSAAEKYGEDMRQSIHTVACPDGPYHWTFCARCML